MATRSTTMGARPGRSGSERAELHERLTLIARMIRLQAVATWAVRLIFLGLAINAIWLAGARFFPYIVPTAMLPAIPLALAALGALVLVFWRPDAMRVASLADRRLGLRERITTAIELERRKEAPASQSAALLSDLQLSDAVSHLRQVEPVEAFPIRLTLREVNAALVAVVLVVALAVWPNPMHQTVRQREQTAQTVRQEAERLNRAADQIAAANADEQSEELRQVEQALRDAAKALEQRAGSNEEALAALAALEQRLQALRAQGSEDMQDALAALAGSMAQDPRTRDAGQSLAKGDFKNAAEQMRQIGQQLDQMSPQERARMARSMRQAGQRAQRANPELGQGLQQAGNAMEQGDSAGAQEGMNQAADALNQASGQLRASSERERAMAQMQQSRSQIGRSAQQGQQARNQQGQNQQGQQGQGQQGQGQGQGQQGQQGQGQGQGQSQQGQGQGQGQQGQGEGQGQGQGEGQGEGQGQGGSEQGDGSEAGGSGAGTGSNPSSDAIYDPVFASSRQERLNPDDQFQPEEAIENPNPEDALQNNAQVSYRQVHARYQEQAVQSMENNYIPIGLKDLVKDYFTSLTPGQEGGR
jgi:hypothetical protein